MFDNYATYAYYDIIAIDTSLFFLPESYAMAILLRYSAIIYAIAAMLIHIFRATIVTYAELLDIFSTCFRLLLREILRL